MKKHLLIYTWKLLRSGSVSIRFYGNLRFEKVTFFLYIAALARKHVFKETLKSVQYMKIYFIFNEALNLNVSRNFQLM